MRARVTLPIAHTHGADDVPDARVTSDALCFDTFELLPVERRLVVGGVPVAIGTRSFDVLVALAERAGKLVSKQELLDLAWPGLVVEENNLQVQITTLRKLLGPQAIATIPGRGYRLAMARKGTAAPDPAAARPREGADA